MPRPAYKTLGAAIASVMDAGGITTIALAEKLRERGWKPDQSLVSKWRNGHARPHDLDIFPDIEEICGVPKGTIFRLAGYVDDPETSTVGFKVNTSDPEEMEIWGLEYMSRDVKEQMILKLRAINAEPPPPPRTQKLPPQRRRRRRAS